MKNFIQRDIITDKDQQKMQDNQVLAPFNIKKDQANQTSEKQSQKLCSTQIEQAPQSIQNKYFLNQSQVTVAIEGFKFNPSELYVHSGTKVTWEVKSNKAVYNSLYDKSGPRFFIVGLPQLEEESPPIHEKESYSLVIETVGTIEMNCSNYMRIKGQLVVLDKSISLPDIMREQKLVGSVMEQVDDFKYSKQKKEVEYCPEIPKQEAHNYINQIFQVPVGSYPEFCIPPSNQIQEFENGKEKTVIILKQNSSKQENILAELKKKDQSNQEDYAIEFLQELEEEEQLQKTHQNQSSKKINSHYLQLYKNDFKDIDEEEGDDDFGNGSTTNNKKSNRISDYDEEFERQCSKVEHFEQKGLNNFETFQPEQICRITQKNSIEIFKNETFLEDVSQEELESLSIVSGSNKKKNIHQSSRKRTVGTDSKDNGYQSGSEDEEEDEEENHQVFSSKKNQKQSNSQNDGNKIQSEQEDNSYDCNTIISEEDQSVQTSKENSLIYRISNSSNNLRSRSRSASNTSLAGPAHSLDRKINNIKKNYAQAKYKKHLHNLSSTVGGFGQAAFKKKKVNGIVQENYLKSPAQSILTTADSSKYSDTTKQHSQKGDSELEADIKMFLANKYNQKRRASTDQTIQESRQLHSNNGNEDSDTMSIKSLKYEPISNIIPIPNQANILLMEQQGIASPSSSVPIPGENNSITEKEPEKDLHSNCEVEKFIKKHSMSILRGRSKSREGRERQERDQSSLNEKNIQNFIKQQSKITLLQYAEAITSKERKKSFRENSNHSKQNCLINQDKAKGIKIISNFKPKKETIDNEINTLNDSLKSVKIENLNSQSLQEEINIINQFLLQRYEVESWLMSMQGDEDGYTEAY